MVAESVSGSCSDREAGKDVGDDASNTEKLIVSVAEEILVA